MILLDLLGTLELRGPDGNEVRPVLTQSKRLALLAYLVVESARGQQRRDRLFALFWPELDQSRARQSLRQALYFLHRSLGDQLIVRRGDEEVGIARGALRCDACAFTELLDAHRNEEALALYKGEFLAGFFIADASPEFEQWVDSTRERLHRRALDAACALADEAERHGRASDAAHWARYAVHLAEDDERSLQRMVALLDRQGDRAGALRAYSEFAARLEKEFGVEPSAETRAMMEAVRKRTRAAAQSVEGKSAEVREAPSLGTRSRYDLRNGGVLCGSWRGGDRSLVAWGPQRASHHDSRLAIAARARSRWMASLYRRKATLPMSR
jgi:DNA-binding SARP family transcriptional activator